MQRFERASGILLHPTSLPGSWGIGDLGDAAYAFVDFLADAGQRLWQMLPLNPTGYGNSPYQSPSAFAGNHLLISLDRLLADNLLRPDDIPHPSFSPDRVDYDAVVALKNPLLQRSFEYFRNGASPEHSAAYPQFVAANADWLEDYTLFMALKDKFEGISWSEWESDIATRQPQALARWHHELAHAVELQKYLQYLFFSQWRQLKAYANKQDIKIIGDAPIFVSYDSADVWANPDLFFLDEQRKPTVVAGVPPDYFSPTGQRWGNPLYRWDKMAEQGYDWWLRRIRSTLTLVDILRLDHFRGFEAYWEVPAEEETAMNGRWVQGPGAAFFQKVADVLGDLPIIAEDLGLITEPVEELRDQFHLPGMKVLHFAFGDTPKNPYLPHNSAPNFVVYTGTHDNNTTLGWFQTLSNREREFVQRYLGRDGGDIAWDLIRLAMSSVADMAIVPLQDVLRFGADTRQNTPGQPSGNWAWRFRQEMLNPGLASGLHLLTATYGRLKLPVETVASSETPAPAQP